MSFFFTRPARALVAALIPALIVSGLAACGGGGSDNTPSTPTTPAAGAGANFTAVGTSGGTVSLAWTAQSGDLAIERRSAGGAFSHVATVSGTAGAFVDSGLAPSTSYDYRLLPLTAGAVPLASANATTGDEAPIATAAGAALGPASSTVLGAQATQVISPDGNITLELPVDAAIAGTELSTQAVANTAPDGIGDGLRVRLSALPSQAATLHVHYDEADAELADGLRIAVQRTDGTWLSLPLAAIDKTERTLSATLPLELLAPPQRETTSSARRTPAAATVSLEFAVVKYLAVRLNPRRATVHVDGTLQLVPQARVRGYDVMAGRCSPYDEDRETCVLSPVMEVRDVPLLNRKPGYTRTWSVFFTPGGDAINGTIAPNGNNTGATYTAPSRLPDPRTVTVLFESTHTASGRSTVLISHVTLTDDNWAGTLTAIDGPSSAGTTLQVHGDVSWQLDLDASTATTLVYRPQGTIGVSITDDDCTVSVSPATAPVTTDPNFGRLEIDLSTTPHRYRLRLVTFWNATINGSCPNKGSTSVSGLTGWGWEGEGVLEGEGHSIAFQTPPGGIAQSWSFGN
ncbi:hypothetical protein ACVNIS_18360 [Sphaerotilaceae bacterium SBD11-9]